MKVVIQLFIGLWCLGFISLQAQDLVQLTDGTKLKGSVLKYSQGQELLIALTSGDSVHFAGASMAHIKGFRIGTKTFHSNYSGYWVHTEMGLHMTDSNWDGVVVDGGTIQVSGGYQWGRMKRLGLLVGRETLTDITTVPVAVTYQGDWWPSKVTPYHFVNVGHAFGWNRKQDQNSGRFESVAGGFRYHAGVGIKIHGQHTDFTLGLGYLVQHATFERNMWNWWGQTNDTVIDKRYYRRFAIRLGIGI